MTGACIVCGSTGVTESFSADDWLLGAVTGPFLYVRCATCDTVRADPQPDDALLARAYPDVYHGEGAEHALERRIGNRLGRREARRLVSLSNAQGDVLDAGCGDGAFLLRLVAAGWRGSLHGLEPGPVAAERARSHGIDVEQAMVEDLSASKRFDLVVLRHVIEHVRDPRFVLERVREALKPGGLIYVATPDERALSARIFGRYWVGYDPPRHLSIFRPAGVRRLLAETGFGLVEERWDFAPDMYTGSLGHVISHVPGRRRLLTSNLNPLVVLPAAVAAGVEVIAHRSTMYAATARLPAE